MYGVSQINKDSAVMPISGFVLVLDKCRRIGEDFRETLRYAKTPLTIKVISLGDVSAYLIDLSNMRFLHKHEDEVPEQLHDLLSVLFGERATTLNEHAKAVQVSLVALATEK